jgi:hypothetical protein
LVTIRPLPSMTKPEPSETDFSSGAGPESSGLDWKSLKNW